jgi:hypothetical protein
VLGSVGRATTVIRRPQSIPPLIPAENLGGWIASFAFVYRSLSAGPEAFKLYGGDRRVSSVGGVVRLSATAGRVRPHVVLGGGQYTWELRHAAAPGFLPFWRGDGHEFSGSLGGGVTLGAPDATFGFTTEARAHRMFQNRDSGEEGRALYTVMMGVRLGW